MITLTREEQKSVVKMVMESYQGVTLTEAKSNENIREEIMLNLKFYNSLKEGFTKDNKTTLEEATGIISTFLSVMGNIKDFLTGTKVIKNIIEWIKGILEKIVAKLSPVIDKFVPQKIQDLSKAGAEAVQKFVKWLYDTVSYKGIAKLFAMIRYKTLKPTDEQKKCMELAAEIAYKWIIISLITFFVIKFIITAWPVILSSTAKGGAAATQQAAIGGGKLSGLLTALAPLKSILAKLGHGSLFKGIFSSTSAAIKIKDARKVNDDIKIKAKEIKNQEIKNIGAAWNQCPIK